MLFGTNYSDAQIGRNKTGDGFVVSNCKVVAANAILSNINVKDNMNPQLTFSLPKVIKLFLLEPRHQ